MPLSPHQKIVPPSESLCLQFAQLGKCVKKDCRFRHGEIPHEYQSLHEKPLDMDNTHEEQNMQKIISLYNKSFHMIEQAKNLANQMGIPVMPSNLINSPVMPKSHMFPGDHQRGGNHRFPPVDPFHSNNIFSPPLYNNLGSDSYLNQPSSLYNSPSPHNTKSSPLMRDYIQPSSFDHQFGAGPPTDREKDYQPGKPISPRAPGMYPNFPVGIGLEDKFGGRSSWNKHEKH